jgi:hypothetical protein
MVVINTGNSNSVTVGGGHPPNDVSKGPQSVVFSLNATKGNNGPDVGLSTQAHSSGHGVNNVSLKTSAKLGKIDNYKVKVGLGDWMDKPGDGDDIDFLICISGAKGGPLKAPFLPNKKANAVDLRCDINLKGIPLKAKLKQATDKDLKLVKCLDSDGNQAWGYLGTVEDAKELLNFSFHTWNDKPVAKLAIDISSVDGLHGL